MKKRGSPIRSFSLQKRGRFSKNSKGLSPVITTVLLIALTVVIIGVIFLWFRGMVEEGVVKFGKNIQLVCDEVDFSVSYSAGTMRLVNNGNVNLFTVEIKFSEGGTFETKDIKDFEAGVNWPGGGLSPGGTFSGNIGSEIGDSDKITVLPVLIGSSDSGQKTFVCGGQYGKEINT